MKFKRITISLFIIILSFVYLPAQVDTWLQKGQTALLQKKFKDAVKHFSKALQIDSLLINAYYNRGLAFLYLDNFNEALNDFNKVIEKDSINADAFNNRGLAKGYLGKIVESIDDFNKAIELDSGFSMAYFNIGNAFMSLNRDNDALKNFNKSIEIDSSNPAVFFQRGTIHYSKGNYNESLYDFTKAIKMGFKTPKIYYNLGNSYYRLNQFENALKNYNEVMKLDSNDYEALNNRAMTYDKLGQSQNAEKDRKRLQKLQGNIKNLPPVESIKFKTFTTPGNYFSISLPDGWKTALSDSDDVIELNISPEPIKQIRDPYYVGVHLSLNLNMDKHWKKSNPDELIDLWKGSVGKNINEYYGYKKFSEKYFSRFGYQGLMTNIMIQLTEQSVPLVLYEYVLSKENTLFFAYFQAPVTDFDYYQKVFEKAIESLILN